LNPQNNQPATTAQSLGTLLKSARAIMRKDEGLTAGHYLCVVNSSSPAIQALNE
jgi:hypothetical protein